MGVTVSKVDEDIHSHILPSLLNDDCPAHHGAGVDNVVVTLALVVREVDDDAT
jgi:hypothetical protein